MNVYKLKVLLIFGWVVFIFGVLNLKLEFCEVEPSFLGYICLWPVFFIMHGARVILLLLLSGSTFVLYKNGWRNNKSLLVAAFFAALSVLTLFVKS